MSIYDDLKHELALARRKHPEKWKSGWHSVGLIRNELEELRYEVEMGGTSEDIRTEALHVAVTAIRFIEDLLDSE